MKQAVVLVALAACGAPAATTGPTTPSATAPAPAAEAAPLPPPGANVPDGTVIEIVEVSPQDAYFADAAEIVGLVCRVEGDLHPSDDPAFHAGGAVCSDGNSYYFYKVRAVASTRPAPPAVAAAPPPPPPPPAPSGSSDEIAVGSQVQIAELSPDDAFYSDAAQLVGMVCTVVEGPLYRQDGAFFSGSMTCSDGEYYSFFKVRVGAAAATTAAASSASVAKHSRFTIAAISPDDAYFENAATIVGLSCQADDVLTSSAAGFYSGSASCNDGKSYYFYRVAISNLVAP